MYSFLEGEMPDDTVNFYRARLSVDGGRETGEEMHRWYAMEI